MPGPLALPLDGSWNIAADPAGIGVRDCWFDSPPAANGVPATVPAAAQQAIPEVEGIIWYWRGFDGCTLESDQRARLRFESVDHAARVWVNGIEVGGHEGGETPFELDVTTALQEQGPNLLAVRVVIPSVEGADGLRLAQTAHRNRQAPSFAGASWNLGGITGSVALCVTEPVHVDDLRVRARLGADTVTITGKVTANPSVTDSAVTVTVQPDSGSSMSNRPVVGQLQARVRLVHGHGSFSLSCRTGVLAPWDLDNPRLYRATVTVETASGHAVHTSLRFGVRDFRFVDGRFQLNGHPLFLRMTHTVNDYPLVTDPDGTLGRLRRDLMHLKVCGFSMVRFIWGGARPEQLDLCDELGLLVYEESFASWPIDAGPLLVQRMDHAVLELIRRDRHHPSVVVWGLLNEARDGAAFDHATGMLDDVVGCDGERMVALNSGRWDSRVDLGSFANPGARSWDVLLGAEGTAADDAGWPPAPGDATWGGSDPRMGDVHPYPDVPHPAATIGYLRHLGDRCAGSVFVSEYGVGSAVDLWRTARHYERFHAVDMQDARFYAERLDLFLAHWERWRLAEVFGHPSRFFAASVERMAHERAYGIDALRSNPNVAGYGLTGAVDQVMCGEGLASTFRELKPHVVDEVGAALAPSRWCVFVSAQNIYRGDDLRIEVVLATDEEFAGTEHPVLVQVFDPLGAPCWRRATTLHIPPIAQRRGQMSFPALDEQVRLDGPPGAYTVLATMQRGGAPTGGLARVQVFDIESKRARLPVMVVGPIAQSAVLASVPGLDAQPWDGTDLLPTQVLLVSGEADDGAVVAAGKALNRGASVICLNPTHSYAPLVGRAGGSEALGLSSMRSWLYQRDDWARPHPLFHQLSNGGLLDWDRFRDLITPVVFRPPAHAQVTAVAGAVRASQDYDAGLTLWLERIGSGRLLSCTFDLERLAGAHPVADQLLYNAVAYLHDR